MNAPAPRVPCASARAITAATPGPGVATARKYTAQNIPNPDSDMTPPAGAHARAGPRYSEPP